MNAKVLLRVFLTKKVPARKREPSCQGRDWLPYPRYWRLHQTEDFRGSRGSCWYNNRNTHTRAGGFKKERLVNLPSHPAQPATTRQQPDHWPESSRDCSCLGLEKKPFPPTTIKHSRTRILFFSLELPREHLSMGYDRTVSCLTLFLFLPGEGFIISSRRSYAALKHGLTPFNGVCR